MHYLNTFPAYLIRALCVYAKETPLAVIACGCVCLCIAFLSN